MAISVELTAVIISSVLFIVWLARLEFKSVQNEKDLKSLSESHDELSSELRNELSHMNKTLSRIEGYMQREK